MPNLGTSSTSGTDQPPSSSTAQDKGKGKLEDLDQAENLQLALPSQDPSKTYPTAEEIKAMLTQTDSCGDVTLTAKNYKFAVSIGKSVVIPFMEEEVGEFTTYHHYPQLDIYESEGITGHVNECEHTEQDKKLIEDMKKDPSKVGEVLISEEHRTRNLVRELKDHIDADLIKELKAALKSEVDEELKRIREDAAKQIEDSREQLEAVQNQLTLMPTQQQLDDLQKLFKRQTEESLKVVTETLQPSIG